MSKEGHEINMSVDDSLIISSNITNILSEIFDQPGEQVQLNSTIEQFKHSQSNKQNQQVDQIKFNKLNQSNSEKISVEEIEELKTLKDSTNTVQIEKNNQDDISLCIEQTIDSSIENETNKLEIINQTTAEEELKKQIKICENETSKLIEMNCDESLRSTNTINLIINSNEKTNDISIDDSLILNDIANIFETSANSSTDFIITKPSKKIDKIKHTRKSDMNLSGSDDNDSLNLKDIKVANDLGDCLDDSLFVKSLPPPKPVFKLSRKRLNCETDSPVKRSHYLNNLHRNRIDKISDTPLITSTKKWRSATYNPKTSSPIKMELGSPLKQINCNLMKNHIFNQIQPTSISSLNMMIQKSDQTPNLMGDYSNEYALPLVSCARHKDLKTINGQTLINLMDGKYSNSISCFTIVDARYPYEFEGGHIDGAKNIYLREDINKYFFGIDKPTLITEKSLIKSTIYKNMLQSSSNSMQRDMSMNVTSLNKNSKRLSAIKEGENDENSELKSTNLEPNTTSESSANNKLKRHAIIFHCEFSSERAPAMCRHLRKIDRELNEDCYPNLYYPEIYLLGGGYKLFYEKYKNHCCPQTYLPMNSQKHKEDLLRFRKKSKTWNCQEQQKFKSLYSF